MFVLHGVGDTLAGDVWIAVGIMSGIGAMPGPLWAPATVGWSSYETSRCVDEWQGLIMA